MFFTRTASGFRVWFFAVRGNGLLRSGLVAGDFVATVVDSTDAASAIYVVSESTQKPAMYYFDIPSSFLLTNGVGEYAVGIQIDTRAGPSGSPHVRTAFTDVLKVTTEDFDSLAQSLIAARTTAIAGSSTTEIRTNLTQADGFFNGMQVIAVNAAGIVVRNVDGYLNTNGAITVTMLPFTPSAGDDVLIISRMAGGSGSSPSVIADAVWDELGAAHTASGSFGEIVQDIEIYTAALRTLL